MYFKFLKDYVTLGDIIMDKIVECQVVTLCKMDRRRKRFLDALKDVIYFI